MSPQSISRIAVTTHSALRDEVPALFPSSHSGLQPAQCTHRRVREREFRAKIEQIFSITTVYQCVLFSSLVAHTGWDEHIEIAIFERLTCFYVQTWRSPLLRDCILLSLLIFPLLFRCPFPFLPLLLPFGRFRGRCDTHTCITLKCNQSAGSTERRASPLLTCSKSKLYWMSAASVLVLIVSLSLWHSCFPSFVTLG